MRNVNLLPGVDHFWGCKVSVLFDETLSILNGATIDINSTQFGLAMNQLPLDKKSTAFENTTFRPKEIRIEDQFGYVVLLIAWDYPGEGAILNVKFNTQDPENKSERPI